MSVETDKILCDAFRNNAGGVGVSLTAEEKQKIRDGMENSPENKNPYDFNKMMEKGELFMDNHPVSWMLGR